MGNNTLSSLSNPFARAMSNAASVKQAVLPQEAGGASGQDDTFEKGLGLLQSFGNQDEAPFGEGGLPTEQQKFIAGHRKALAEVQQVFDAGKAREAQEKVAQLDALRMQIQQEAQPKIGNANVNHIHNQTVAKVINEGQGIREFFTHLANSLKLFFAQIRSADAWAQRAAAKKASQSGDLAMQQAFVKDNAALAQSQESALARGGQ